MIVSACRVVSKKLRRAYRTRNNVVALTRTKVPDWYAKNWKTFSPDCLLSRGNTVVPVVVAVWWPELYFAKASPALRLKGNRQWCPHCKTTPLEVKDNIQKVVHGLEGMHVLCAKKYICKACQKAKRKPCTYNGWNGAKMGVWKSVKYTSQMKDIRRNEIRKFQGRIAKCVASAAGKRKKKKLRKSKN